MLPYDTEISTNPCIRHRVSTSKSVTRELEGKGPSDGHHGVPGRRFPGRDVGRVVSEKTFSVVAQPHLQGRSRGPIPGARAFSSWCGSQALVPPCLLYRGIVGHPVFWEWFASCVLLLCFSCCFCCCCCFFVCCCLLLLLLPALMRPFARWSNHGQWQHAVVITIILLRLIISNLRLQMLRLLLPAVVAPAAASNLLVFLMLLLLLNLLQHFCCSSDGCCCFGC